MRKAVLIILGFILLVSCTENRKSQSSWTNTELGQAKLNETELVIQKILDLPDLQWIYHPELKERIPVKVAENQKIVNVLNLTKFGQKVKILKLSELEKEGIKDFVLFDSLVIKDDTAEFKLHYKIEGVGSEGKLVRKDGEWIIYKYSVWEN